ncbi:hypothetical protein RMN57_17150 [Kitasatospora sp. CM 4170]|uniref:Integral membrane protein n=1 Tax=Kitasatospora aburaviensis TaxID=67265 RepID=A0ABW1EXB6_9ACTN|nr:hypothetical protein [Kitasatospora sp. CM 4170]WNM46303.1 hypothetical protein RMN57_17150 [Kitasatospora sp. CM 4170]
MSYYARGRRERLQLALDTLNRYFEELSKSIDSQQTRAGNLVAISAFVVTFASASGFIGKDAALRFPAWASTALWAVIAVQVIAVAYVLLPRPYVRGPDVKEMMEGDASEPWLTDDRIADLRIKLNSTAKMYRHSGIAYEFALLCLLGEISVILAAVISST